MKILLVGISTRALAQSAARIGYEILSLDFFGDSDQPEGAEVYSLVRDFGEPPELSALARVASRFVSRADKVVIEAGLENEPALLEICSPKKRWGNSAETVTGARDLGRVREVLRGTDIVLPKTIRAGEKLPTSGHYLIKDPSHSGGRGVREWDGVTPPTGQDVLQVFVEGELASACFVADGRQASLLGLTRQYTGESGLNAPQNGWCGNVAPWNDPFLEPIILKAVNVLTAHFGLVGLNGIDFILQNNVPYLLEVNPRPPASFELFERLKGLNAFRLHVEACEGMLPRFQQSAGIGTDRSGLALGKGILYASKDITIGDSRSWAAQDVADIPHLGEQIPQGAPICTLFAKGENTVKCWDAVLSKARNWPPSV
jgi:predicted ATP-grasp superfamily ATP-dependent carboligase